MKISQLLNKSKIFVVLIFSLLIVLGLGKLGVFMVNSPQVNPQFIADVKRTPKKVIGYITGEQQRGKALVKEIPQVTPPLNAVFLPIAKGIYAAEGENGKKYYKIEPGTNIRIEKKLITLPDGTKKYKYIITPLE